MDGRIGINGIDASGGSRSLTAERSQVNGLDRTGVKSMSGSKRAWAACASRRRAKVAGLLIACAAAIMIVSAFAMLPSGDRKASTPEKVLNRAPPGFPFTVFGFVYDTDGTTPLVGANVTITNLNTTEVNWNETGTDEFGFWQIDVNNPILYPSQYNVGNVINVTVVLGSKVGYAEGFTYDPDAAFLWLDVTVVDLAIPEFPTLILPVLGIAALVIVVQLNRRRETQ